MRADEDPAQAGRSDERGQHGSPLAVGILVGSFIQPRWAAKIVADIQSSSLARVVLVVTEADQGPRPGLLRRAWSRRHSLLHDAYVRLDGRLFKSRPDAFGGEDIRELVRDCAVLEVAPQGNDPESVRERGLDVLVVLSPDADPRRFASSARHGAWTLRHAADERDDEAVAGLWEVLSADPTTGSQLIAWSGDSATSRVIYRSYGPTDHVSVCRNRQALYWKSAAFVLRKLKDLAAEGPNGIRAVPDVAPRAPRRVPGNLTMARLALRLALRYLKGKIRDLLARDQWYLAYRLGTGIPRDGQGLVRVLPPRDRFWADPCGVQAEDGRRFVFFEELRYDRPKGTIVAIEIDPTKGPGTPFPVLERPYHLSYPQVFRWQGTYYMVPESSQNRTVTLFRCASFPHAWVEDRDLLTGVDAVDPTIAEIDGRWWLFVNIAPYGGGTRDELHVFHASSPLGPFVPHAKNPIKSDCRSARPGGPLFRHEGCLYRPAQNCAGAYGSSIILHRVERLTPEEYLETQVEDIVPAWDPEARRAHTFGHADGLVVIDLMRRRRRLY